MEWVAYLEPAGLRSLRGFDADLFYVEILVEWREVAVHAAADLALWIGDGIEELAEPVDDLFDLPDERSSGPLSSKWIR